MNLPEFDENKTLERPRFQPSGDTLWHGLRARTGEFHTADGSVGRAIISRSPLVQLTDGESAVLSKFSRFLYRWISISSQMSGAEMNSPRNLIAKQYKKLIRYRNSDVDMELGDWDRLERSNGFFQVPSTYRVESLNRVGGSDTTKE